MEPTRGITLHNFILQNQRKQAEATGEFSALLIQISLAARVISRELSRAGLIEEALGFTGDINVQGEEVRKMDEYANETFIRAFRDTGLICVLVSEELEGPEHLLQTCPVGGYALLIDPLDGSSNLDCDVTVGSSFAVLRQRQATSPEASLLQPGIQQVAAGYILYGPSTMMVYTTGDEVNGFTLDSGIGEFLLSHPHMRIPEKGKYYSANEANYQSWSPQLQAYVDHIKSTKGYSGRYVGSLVADIHRTLLHGGVFLYPGTAKNPEGKLRLLYEANPLAYVLEKAGGKATTGTERILDIVPTELHQRVPVIMGSPQEVSLAEKYIAGPALV
jgi:fructose-1,6-bisphosphatase I